MKSLTPVLGEQSCGNLPEEEIVDLSTSELQEVGGGICDPGVLEVEK
jgi:hypothetical protein